MHFHFNPENHGTFLLKQKINFGDFFRSVSSTSERIEIVGPAAAPATAGIPENRLHREEGKEGQEGLSTQQSQTPSSFPQNIILDPQTGLPISNQKFLKFLRKFLENSRKFLEIF